MAVSLPPGPPGFGATFAPPPKLVWLAVIVNAVDGSIGNYNYRYAVAVKQMMAERTLLAEDGAAMVSAAVARVSPLLPLLPASN